MQSQNTIPISLSALDFDGPAWLGTARQAAREHFQTLGFPSRRREDWRYTDTRSLLRIDFTTPFADAALRVHERSVAPFMTPNAAYTLVFVNGLHVPSLSRGGDPKGVAVTSLAQQLKSAPERVREHFGRAVLLPEAAFVALNTACFNDGAHIEVKRGTLVEKPIELLFFTTDEDVPTTSHTRVLVEAADGSCVTVIERHVGLGRQPYLKNAVTEVVIGQSALVRHVKVQEEGPRAFHFATLGSRPAAGGRLESHVVSIGGWTVRNAVHAVLASERSSASLNGLFAAAGRQSLDHYTEIDHAVPRCESTELYKGVVSDEGVGSFLGRVVIRKGAVESNTDQQVKTLLLSEKARANCKPQLEIDNDDVKATHGAAIGQLDDEALFYLVSRGIDRATARGLLVSGFVHGVLDTLPVPGMADALARRILGNLHERDPEDAT